MDVMYLVPRWFYGFDALMQLSFAFVSLLVALYAHQIYKISKRSEIKLFSYSFFLIFLSYIVLPVVVFFFALPMNNDFMNVAIHDHLINNFIIYSHVLLYLAGLVTLAYTTLPKKNHKTYVLLLSLVIGVVLVVPARTNVVYMISSLLLLFVFIHFSEHCLTRKTNRIVITSVAFFFLFLASIDLMFSDNHHIYYVGGHVLNLVGYLLILLNLAVTWNHGKETRQT